MKILFIVATMCLFGLNTYAASYDEVYNQVFFFDGQQCIEEVENSFAGKSGDNINLKKAKTWYLCMKFRGHKGSDIQLLRKFSRMVNGSYTNEPGR
jgi:hypothetical protein